MCFKWNSYLVLFVCKGLGSETKNQITPKPNRCFALNIDRYRIGDVENAAFVAGTRALSLASPVLSRSASTGILKHFTDGEILSPRFFIRTVMALGTPGMHVSFDGTAVAIRQDVLQEPTWCSHRPRSCR